MPMNMIGRGADVAAHKSKVAFIAIGFFLVLYTLLATAYGVWHAYANTTAFTRAVAGKYVYAEAMNLAGYPTQLTIHFPEQGAVTMPGEELAEAPQAQRRMQVLLKVWSEGFLIALPYAIGLFIFSLVSSAITGYYLTKDEHLRGVQLLDPKKLARLMYKRDQDSDIHIGEVPIARGSEVEHTLITGAPGTGKSVLIESWIDKIQERGEPAIIYDPTGDFIRKFYDEERGDTILNPFDARSPSWTPWNEMHSVADGDRMAESIIPESGDEGQNKVFSDAARSLFSAVLSKWFPYPEKQDLGSLLRILLTSDFNQLGEITKGTEAGSIFDDEENKKMALSVRATLSTYARSLRFLPARTDRNGGFSVRKWVEGIDTRYSPQPFLFIASRKDYHKALMPLISCWLDNAAAGLLSMEPKKNRRCWFIIDELPTLQKMESVQQLLAEGRKYGAAGVLGVQSVAQLKETYGAEGAETMTGLTSTWAVFRAPDPETADWNSQALGTNEVKEHDESYTYAGEEERDSANISTQRQERRIVLASEISNLEKLHAYVRLPGLPVSKTPLTPKDRYDKAEPIINKDLDDTAWTEMLQSSGEDEGEESGDEGGEEVDELGYDKSDEGADLL